MMICLQKILALGMFLSSASTSLHTGAGNPCPASTATQLNDCFVTTAFFKTALIWFSFQPAVSIPDIKRYRTRRWKRQNWNKCKFPHGYCLSLPAPIWTSASDVSSAGRPRRCSSSLLLQELLSHAGTAEKLASQLSKSNNIPLPLSHSDRLRSWTLSFNKKIYEEDRLTAWHKQQ